MALRETAYLRPGEVFPEAHPDKEDCSDATAADEQLGTCPHRAGTCDGHGCCPPADRPPPAVTPQDKEVLGERGSDSVDGGNGPGAMSAAQCGPGHHPDATSCRSEHHVSPHTAAQPDAASGNMCPGSDGAAGICDGSAAAKPPGSKLLDYIRWWSVKRCTSICASCGQEGSASACRFCTAFRRTGAINCATEVLAFALRSPCTAASAMPFRSDHRHNCGVSWSAGNRTGRISGRICSWSRRRSSPGGWNKARREIAEQTGLSF